jgi:hypothetical protein
MWLLLLLATGAAAQSYFYYSYAHLDSGAQLQLPTATYFTNTGPLNSDRHTRNC